ncbi:hypothetical protein K260102G11_07160 [Bacteroides uniformis]|uniref:Uncharacterized protein n=2 Tax=root TaxID=1 RepID=H1DEB1_9BACT|nr:hypothetical protein [Odoribacter laneus]EHP50008.1 hypothetical protein HMPREF9449_00597 [Odoribacter laneus YIT 12061]
MESNVKNKKQQAMPKSEAESFGIKRNPAIRAPRIYLSEEEIIRIMRKEAAIKKSNHSIFRHDNFIGCFSADKIKIPARKYFCFNIPVYKNMVEELSCRSPYHEEYIRTGASGNPEDLCH